LPRFVVLPTREPIPMSTEMLSSAKVGNLINDLRDRYESRICIFDCRLCSARMTRSPCCPRSTVCCWWSPMA
jgi:hypothetical protein